MLTTCWSPKGGVGTSVVAATLALRTAASGVDCLLVDLDGDQPAVLGAPPPSGPGVTDWLAAGDDVPVDALGQLETPVVERLALLARGDGPEGDDDRLSVMAEVLATVRRTVGIDAGPSGRGRRWWVGHGTSLLLLRP